MTTGIWSEHEISLLKKLAGTMSASQIGLKIGRTKDAVKSQINRWKLPSYAPSYSKPTEVKEASHAPVTEPTKAVLEPKLRQTVKPLRQAPPSREYPPLEWCSQCHSPVSNWSDHWSRMPECKKRA